MSIEASLSEVGRVADGVLGSARPQDAPRADPSDESVRRDGVRAPHAPGENELESADGRGGVRTGRRRPVPPKLYRIGEVVEYSGMSRQTIHNYTTMGLLTESRWTQGGHRLYDESVFGRLDTIAELKARNRSLRHIREYFNRLDASQGRIGR